MARKDHLYVSLDKNLLKIVDTCVSTIFSNGTQVYETRRDFVTKSIQNQIDKEKKINPDLEKIIHANYQELIPRIGGNRIAVQ